MHRVLRALWSLFWTLFYATLAAVTIAGLYNVTRDDFDVQQMAEGVACEADGEGCSLRRLLLDRGPTSETLEFLNAKQEQIRVRCIREHTLIGEYACEVRDRRPYIGPVLMPPPRPPALPKGNGGRARKPRPSTSTSTPPSAAPVAERDGGV